MVLTVKYLLGSLVENKLGFKVLILRVKARDIGLRLELVLGFRVRVGNRVEAWGSGFKVGARVTARFRARYSSD